MNLLLDLSVTSKSQNAVMAALPANAGHVLRQVNHVTLPALTAMSKDTNPLVRHPVPRTWPTKL